MTSVRAITTLRVVGFLLVGSAEVYLVARLGDQFTPANHFSYFTVLSDLFAAVVLLVGVFRPVPGPVRGAAVVYLLVTGVVYAVLLREVDVSTPAYANWVLHVVMPVLVPVDWLAEPPRKRIGLRQAAWWLAFPIGYLAYTLLRGPVVDWYPYPFLDPGQGGYAKVALMSVLVAAAIGLVAWLVAWVGNRLAGRRPAASVV